MTERNNLKKTVTIYTDGACLGNPGPGGWCAILIYGSTEKEINGGEQNTTNNRMELLAAIEGLKALKESCNVTLYSDSKYVTEAFNKNWITDWELKAWRKSDNKPVKNQDLWEALLSLTREHNVVFNYIAGHSGHKYNERCDKTAQKTAESFRETDMPDRCGDSK